MAVTQTELAFFRDAIPFWNDITKAQQATLAQATTLRTYSKGQSLHEGSQDCTGLMLVHSGQVRTFILSESGKEITLYHLFERDVCIFSASCMLKNISFDVYIEAEQDSDILLIPTEIYKTLNKNSIAVSNYTSQLIESRFSDVMWVMEQVVFMKFDKRLANFLLEQCVIDNSDTLSITHEAIANHLGSAREVVTRMLQHFQNDGILSVFRGGITLLDKKKLKQLS